MDNLILDYENKIKIPQNKYKYFRINKYEKWNYSIIISFDFSEEIDYINLFLIIKSYAVSSLYAPYSICTLFSESNLKIITQKENIQWFINVDYHSFVEWVNYRIKHDKKYDDNSNLIGIIIIFPKGIIKIYEDEQNNIDIMTILKPIYPWNEYFLNNFKTDISRLRLYQKTIDTNEKRIKLLEDKIKEYELKIKEYINTIKKK